MSDRTHEDDQLIIEHYERTIAEVKQAAHLWQARCDELLRAHNERPEVQQAEKLQAALESSLAFQQEDEELFATMRGLLGEVKATEPTYYQGSSPLRKTCK
jgi:hypothetical protein